MPISCINCGEADLQIGDVELTGKIRGKSYTVKMQGLVCPKCHYKTIEGTAMPEFGRLLADKYREEHGLLTSVGIKARRKLLEMNQQEFAQYLGVGIASVKRWEMGKIQDARSNQLIVEKTHVPVSSAQQYRLNMVVVNTTLQCGSANPFINNAVITLEPKQSVLFQGCFDDAMELYQCGRLTQTNTVSAVLELKDHQTVPPHIAGLFNQEQERRSHVRRH